jgi:hypothetical protein
LSLQERDDFDLNEIFADYFISEFEDPINAHASSMENCSGTAASVAMSQQAPMNLQNAQAHLQIAAANATKMKDEVLSSETLADSHVVVIMPAGCWCFKFRSLLHKIS